MRFNPLFFSSLNPFATKDANPPPSRIALIPPVNPSATAVPPANLNAIWSRGPARGGDDWYTAGYPIGNGFLGEMVGGAPGEDSHWVNIATLWTGGPFRNASYSGGNPPASSASQNAKVLAAARAHISKTGTGDMGELMGDSSDRDYGSFTTAGRLSILSPSTHEEKITEYTRTLDFDLGVVRVSWVERGEQFNRTSFCSFPSEVCITHTTSSRPLTLQYFLSTANPNVADATCVGPSSIRQRGRVSNDTHGVQSMLYEVVAELRSTSGDMSCSGGVVTVVGATEQWVSWTGATEFSLKHCTRAYGFSCRTPDPVSARLINESYSTLLASHLADYSSLSQRFTLDIGQAHDPIARSTPTDLLVAKFDPSTGSPLLEHNVFSYGRHLLISSCRDREGYLPPNLQGLWSKDLEAPWSGDYHMDVNLQMMQWGGEPTGIGGGVKDTGKWLLYTIMDRGSDTAKILYNTTGFVAHTQSNVFGYTGMQGNLEGVFHPGWSDLTQGVAWTLQLLYDHLAYSPTEDLDFFRDVTWPLMKKHAEFQLEFLVRDEYFNDGTLVVAPCNSPEKDFTTLGCTMNQQQIFELLHNILKMSKHSGAEDAVFLARIRTTLETLYDEWKIDRDDPEDEHRHLSHLMGVYPGWQISGYYGDSLGNQAVLDAAAVSLAARGNGTVDDDAGWSKIMRALVASSLGDAERNALEYRLAIFNNMNGNLLSTYGRHTPLFQMDANGGATAVVANMLFQSLDSTREYRNVTRINLLPALPATWPSGSFTGGRVRDGLRLDLVWSNSKVDKATITGDKLYGSRLVVIKSTSFVAARLVPTLHDAVLEGGTVKVLIGVGETVELEFQRD